MFELTWDSVIQPLQQARRLSAEDARQLLLAFHTCDSCATSSWGWTSRHRVTKMARHGRNPQGIEVAMESFGETGMRAAVRRLDQTAWNLLPPASAQYRMEEVTTAWLPPMMAARRAADNPGVDGK